jgi:hypothetical protein
LRASSRELRRPGTRGCTDGACLASGRLPKRATAGRRWPKPKAAFARPSGSLTERGRHPGVEARVREGGAQRLPPGGTPTEAGGTTEDTQRDIRRHLPWGSFPFGESSTGDRCVPVCLTDTIRPQGFSPSRRFDPARAVWVCFTPHPPLGFWPSELFPRGQPLRLSAPDALLPLG